MPDFEELRTLIALAKYGSVTKAATNLRTSRARLRRKLASLEEQAQTQLLIRVGGVLTPTEPGASLIEGGRRLIDEASLLIAHTREVGTKPSGLLRVGVQPGFPFHLTHLAGETLAVRYPALKVELRVAENPITFLPTEADLAVTVDEDIEVQDCTRFQIVQLRYQLMATATYLSEKGTPSKPEDLHNHRLAVWRPPSGDYHHLHLTNGGRFKVDPSAISSNERYLLYVAANNKYMAYVPCPPFPDPDFPVLVPVLTDQVGRSINGQMFIPNVLKNVPRVKTVLDAAIQASLG